MIITVGTAQVVAASGRESRLQHGEPPDPGAGRGRQEGLPSQTNMFWAIFLAYVLKIEFVYQFSYESFFVSHYNDL